MTRKEFEIRKIIDAHERELKAKLIEEVTKSYFSAMKEINRRNLSKHLPEELPRLDCFLAPVFFFIFNKLHRGDRFKAFQILEEIKLKVYNL